MMGDKLKIGMVVDTYLPVIGGAEIHVLELSRALQPLVQEINICTGSPSSKESTRDEFPVTRIPSLGYSGWKTWLRLPFALPALIRFIRNVDVVHCHYTFFLSFLGIGLGKLLGKRTAVTLHGLGTLDSSVRRSLVMRFFRWASFKWVDVVIATSEEMFQVALRYVPGSRIKIITNGVDTTRYQPGAINGDKEFVILTMRRLAPKNGVQYLVEAAPLVIAAIPNAVFWIAGQGKLESYIRQRVQELGITASVRFIGLVPHSQTVDFYRKADLVVFPSSAESTSLACLEAMAMEKPIVASSLEAYRDMLGEGERGLLVNLFDRLESDYNAPLVLPPDRIRSLAEAVIKLARDSSLRMEMGARARRYVIDTFDWHQIAAQVVQAYRI
ncbi:glycosyltransferase family 4 protein [Chloroflexota bacterium]